jgi:hypothetical protein
MTVVLVGGVGTYPADEGAPKRQPHTSNERAPHYTDIDKMCKGVVGSTNATSIHSWWVCYAAKQCRYEPAENVKKKDLP